MILTFQLQCISYNILRNMNSDENILQSFKHKLNDLTEIASNIPQDKKANAREYFNTNLDYLLNLLHGDCKVEDRDITEISALNAVSSRYSNGSEKNANCQSNSLFSQQGSCCVHSEKDCKMEQKLGNNCEEINELDSQKKRDGNDSKTMVCSVLSYVGNCNTNSDISITSIKYRDRVEAERDVIKTNKTIEDVSASLSEVSSNSLLQDMQEIGSCVLPESDELMKETADTNTSQNETNEIVSATVDYLPDFPQETKNVNFVKDKVSQDELLILRVELDDGTVQDFQVSSDFVEEKPEKKNDRNLSPIHSTSDGNKDDMLENSSTSQKDPAIMRMNLRNRPQLSFAQKQKGPGRPKNENIPEPEINSRGEPVFICEVCKTSVKSYHALIVHMRTHTGSRPFCCGICNKSFTTKGNLKAHAVTHSDDKPWKCEFCSKTFKEKKVLKTHERIHTGEKPFSCSICTRAFNQRSTLLEHILTHSNNRPHLCDVCGQGFRGASSLKAHKKRHLGMKEFQCNLCNKAFIRKNDLTRHSLTHSGDRPYSCELCSKSFTRMSFLKEHMNLHTGAKPYICSECGEAFSESMPLTRHKKKHKTRTENKNDFDESTQLEFLDDKTYTSVITEQENFYTLAVPEQTVLNAGETLIQVLSDESSKVEYSQKLRSLLISAANNDCIPSVDSSKKLYQVLCVNPDTQEVVSQGEGHKVIVEGHSDDIMPLQ